MPTNFAHRPFDIKVNQNDTTKYGSKSLRILRPHIWNCLPKQIKEVIDYSKFKKYIDKWSGAKCKCISCSYLNQRWEVIFSTTSESILLVQKRFYILCHVLFRKFVKF